MISKSLLASTVANYYKMNFSKQTGLSVYNDLMEKIKEVQGEFMDTGLKKSRGENISAEELRGHDLLLNFRDEMEALIAEYDSKKDKLSKLCVLINGVGLDWLGRQRRTAKNNYNIMKEGLGRYGINVISPGFKNNSESGLIYHYSDLSSKEDNKGLPISFYNPNHEFSKQIKHLAKFIKSDWGYSK